MASGPAFGPGRLTSPSTGRDGVVQLIDVAPTILWLLGAPAPSAMLGVHWQSVAEAAHPGGDRRWRPGRPGPALAWPRCAWSGPYSQAVLAVAALYLLVVACGLGPPARRPPLALSAFVASVPVGELADPAGPVVAHRHVEPAAPGRRLRRVVGVCATLSPWPRDRRWRIAGVVGARDRGGDRARRRHRVAALPRRAVRRQPDHRGPLPRHRQRRLRPARHRNAAAGSRLVAGTAGPRAALTVLGLGAVAVAVDGYPGLGDDFGGVLALLPAVCVLALVVSGVRVSWRYALGIPAATVVIAAVFALVDYARPAAQRTHLGRFVQQVADGTAWDVMHRKLGSSLHTFAAGWPRWITLVWLVLARRRRSSALRRGRLRMGPDVDVRTTRGLAVALAVLGVLGAGAQRLGARGDGVRPGRRRTRCSCRRSSRPHRRRTHGPRRRRRRVHRGPRDVTAVTF